MERKVLKRYDQISKTCCLGEDAASNFIKSIIEERKFCTDIMKKHFNKELVMTKEDDEDLL